MSSIFAESKCIIIEISGFVQTPAGHPLIWQQSKPWFAFKQSPWEYSGRLFCGQWPNVIKLAVIANQRTRWLGMTLFS